MSTCVKPVLDIVIGVIVCLGGFISYPPQYVSLIRAGSSEAVSEFSLLILNVSNAALTLNSIIFNWASFQCFVTGVCKWWQCLAGMLPVLQIGAGWLAVFPLYIIYLRLKVKNSDRAIIYDILNFFIFIIVLAVVLVISLIEEWRQDKHFFGWFASVLGVFAAVTGALVWIPQIIKLIRYRNPEGLSLVMFLLQVPGGAVIVFFQAFLYKQNWTTWISYVAISTEQLIMVVLLLYIYYERHRHRQQILSDLQVDESEDYILYE